MKPRPGQEPDYRFTLANERTFLAWVRTALGLVAGAVAARELVESRVLSLTLPLACLAVSAVIAVGCYPRWRTVQTAMRTGRPLPVQPLVPFLGLGTLAVLATVGTGLVLGR